MNSDFFRAWSEQLAAASGQPTQSSLADLLRSNEAPGADGERFERRRFLRLMGASLALTGACTNRPHERIVPYVRQPEEIVPGRPLWFATSFAVGAHAVGLLVESHEGRPTKVEGHPDHPASRGAASALAQALVLGLYDPDRAKRVREARDERSWEAFGRAFGPNLSAGAVASRYGRGAGLHVLLEPTGSPLVASMVGELAQQLPEAQVHTYAPFDADERDRAGERLWGRALTPRCDFRAADVVVSFADDVLVARDGTTDARDFMARRRGGLTAGTMNRLYMVETSFSTTGAKADHRFALPPHELPRAVAGLLAEVEALLPPGEGSSTSVPAGVRARLRALAGGQGAMPWLRHVASDLVAAAGRSVVLAGDDQPADVHVLVHALNERLGNVGRTVTYVPSPRIETAHRGLGALAEALARGAVESLVILEGNPAYSAPGELGFRDLIGRAGRSVYLGLYENETARACRWFVPALHAFESWGDGRARDGTVSLTQPLIAPLYGGHAPVEVLAVLLGQANPSAHDLLRSYWAARGLRDADTWEQALARGYLPGTAYEGVGVKGGGDQVVAALERSLRGSSYDLELNVVPDAKVYDGRFANNAWLQELPDPITRLTWGHAALVSARTAAALGVATGEVVVIAAGGREVEAPLLVQPGHADGTVTLAAGYGRAGAERLARGVGGNAFSLRRAHGESSIPITLRRTGRTATMAFAQEHRSLEGRDDLVRSHTVAEHGAAQHDPGAELYHLEPKGKHQWAMAIDLLACTGCSACVVACQAENNVPVVGKAEVLRGRAMHWLRIDHYVTGPAEQPEMRVQPMLCQHCEKAPCEYVCPVGATTHSEDGLNQMTYNRCVGTRFCSNNCPYKVRRFNYFNYHRDADALAALAKNPDVTVRARGVMEKCTYCVQRIRRAEIEADVQHRPLRPADVVPACAQTCPTEAIVFGSLTDPGSPVRRLRSDARSYAALGELGTKPRTTYLAAVTNPNPALAEGAR